jgi:hypothetical protein
MRYCLLNGQKGLEFVAIPTDHMYQFIALNRRLHKEIDKLTTPTKPFLPYVLGECSELELLSTEHTVQNGLEYINQLEQQFAEIKEENYPLISLLTEIRAFQAQLEYLEEEE